jgi:ketosteroid isomerase-like protein
MRRSAAATSPRWVLDALTDDVDWHLQGPSVIPFAGPRRGREGVAEFFSTVGEALEFEQFEPRKFVAQGDTVVVLGYERSIVKPTGRSFEQEWVHVYTLRDGKIATGRFFKTLRRKWTRLALPESLCSF